MWHVWVSANFAHRRGSEEFHGSSSGCCLLYMSKTLPALWRYFYIVFRYTFGKSFIIVWSESIQRHRDHTWPSQATRVHSSPTTFAWIYCISNMGIVMTINSSCHKTKWTQISRPWSNFPIMHKVTAICLLQTCSSMLTQSPGAPENKGAGLRKELDFKKGYKRKAYTSFISLLIIWFSITLS